MVILIAPSGAGKTKVEAMLEKLGFIRVISYTTRKPREGEIEGVSYHFITEDKFKELFDAGFFAEYTNFSGAHYGAAKKDIIPNAVAVFEPNGLQQIKDQSYEHISFYIDVPEETRRDRMLKRNDDTVAVEKRILNDRTAFKDAKESVDFIVENIDIDQTVEKIITIISEEKAKRRILPGRHVVCMVGCGHQSREVMIHQLFIENRKRRTEIIITN